jgi:hypothetical protein
MVRPFCAQPTEEERAVGWLEIVEPSCFWVVSSEERSANP